MNKLLTIVIFVMFLTGVADAGAGPTGLTLVRELGPVGYQVQGTRDFDGDGRAELLVTRPSGGAVDVLESADVPRGYAVRHRFDGTGLTGLPVIVRAIDGDGDGAMEIYILWHGGPSILTVHDGKTLQQRVSGPIIDASDFDIGDVDGDGKPELVAGAGGSIHLYDPATLAPKGHVWAPVSIRTLRIADVAGDARAEVVTNGAAIELARAPDLTATVVWTHPDGEMDWFTPVDVDSDGKMEIAGGGLYSDFVLHRIHPTAGSLVLRQILPDHQISHVVFEDVDDDGRTDAVLSINNREIKAIDLVAGDVHWSIERSHPGASAVAVAHVQGDDQLQVVYLDGEVLRVENVGPEGNVLWSTVAPGPVIDVTSLIGLGGRCDLAALAGNPAFGLPALPETFTGTALASSAASATDWLPPLSWPDYYDQVAILPARDATRPDETMVVAGSALSEGAPTGTTKLWFLDAAATLKRTVVVETSLVPQTAIAVEAGDLADHDVFMLARDPAEVGGSRLIAVDANNGAVKWQSDEMPTDMAGLWKLVGLDLGADGTTEVVMCCGLAGEATVYRPTAGTAAVKTYSDVQDASAHVPTSGSTGLVLLRDGGLLQLFGTVSSVPDRQIQIDDWYPTIAATTLYPSTDPLVAVVSSSIRIYSFDSAEPLLSAPGPGAVQVKAMDVGCDNQPELVIPGSLIRVYRLGNNHVYTDGFEPPVP